VYADAVGKISIFCRFCGTIPVWRKPFVAIPTVAVLRYAALNRPLIWNCHNSAWVVFPAT